MGGSSSSLAPLKAMETPMVLDKFLGPWHVIANIPTPFEKNAWNAMEVYTKSEGSKTDIDIDFKYRKGAFDGPLKHMSQKGWIFNKDTQTEWRISPVIAGLTMPFKLPYIIVDVTDSPLTPQQYATTIIGYPDRSYLWIMSREPKMSEEQYKAQLDKVKDMGYDLEKIQKVPQQTKEERAAAPESA